MDDGQTAEQSRLTSVRSFLVPAALGKRAVRTTLFHFHNASACAAGKHTVMLLLSRTHRRTDGRTVGRPEGRGGTRWAGRRTDGEAGCGTSPGIAHKKEREASVSQHETLCERPQSWNKSSPVSI